MSMGVAEDESDFISYFLQPCAYMQAASARASKRKRRADYGEYFLVQQSTLRFARLYSFPVT
jgi:hypothetical protein